MNRIFNYKNLTKKMIIFSLLFTFLFSLNINKSSAEILKYANGTDLSTCNNNITKCKINWNLKNKDINNPSYKLANTKKNLNGDLNVDIGDYKLEDFNISVDDFIKQTLYSNKEYGYFGNKLDDNFNNFNKSFTDYLPKYTEDKKNINLLFLTIGANINTDEKKLEIAKNITKILGNSTTSIFKYEDLQITVLTYYYLKEYKVLDQYILINKSIISSTTQKELNDLKDGLRNDIYKYLYKTDSIIKSNNCSSNGTNLDLCDIFAIGKFKTNAEGLAPDIEFDVMSDVNLLKLDASKYSTTVNNINTDPTITNSDPNTRNDQKTGCPLRPKLYTISGTDNLLENLDCSIGAYLINIIIQGISGLVHIFVDLAGALFDWIYKNGVIGFNDWVVSSDAYKIYKTIILSLIVSVMTFFVFYLIIRRLLDDDGEKMNKILPRLILTALFVYFSFTITGWVIDQSNIITIRIYRSMTVQTNPNSAQSIADILKRTLSLDNGGNNNDDIANNYNISIGTWEAVPYTAGQLIVSIVSVFVLFEGAILILSRTIILLLCMIFSPIMLFPDGLTDITDKYKKIVIDNFTGNVLLGPVFMFLVLIAVEIGKITTKMVGTGPSLSGSAPAGTSGFLGGIISSVLVIVVLQLAISASKNLSGSVGEKLGGTISKYAGGAAFGSGAKILRGTVGRGASYAQSKGWMMGKEGSGRHKFMSTLYGAAANSTFDARNTQTFKTAANVAGVGENSFGKGGSKNFNDSFKTKLYSANKYHNSLDEGGKQRNIARLRKLGSSGDLDSKRIAESLEKNWKPSINERINNDSEYNKRFDKAQNEKNIDKRMTETTKVINEHFKENGLGNEHFSKELEKPENNKLKTEYENAINEKDPIQRKEALTKIISEVDKKQEKNNGSISPLTESSQKIEVKNESIQNENKIINEEQTTISNNETPRLLRNYVKNREDNLKSTKNQNIMNSFNKLSQQLNEENKNIVNQTPTAKDLDAQNSLKNRLKEKWTPEKIKETKEQSENKKTEDVIQKSIDRNNRKENNSDDEPDNNGPFDSPGGSSASKISMSVDKSGKLIQMHTPEQLSILNKNRNNSKEGGDKAA